MKLRQALRGTFPPASALNGPTGATIRVRDRAPALVEDPGPSRPGSFTFAYPERKRSACLLNAGFHHFLGAQKLRIFFVPEVLARAEWTEFSREWSRRSNEFLGISIHSHKHIMASQPASGDDLRHRNSP
jgi:hypothetical protein